MDPRPIPTCWDEMDDADKTMMSMKQAGKSWAEIAEVYQENTGQATQPRYDQMTVRLYVKLTLIEFLAEPLDSHQMQYDDPKEG